MAPARRGTVPIIPHRRPPATAPATGLAARARRRPAADGAIQPGRGSLECAPQAGRRGTRSRTRSPCANEETPDAYFPLVPGADGIDRRGAAAGRAGRRPDQHEDQHLDRPELAPGRGDRHLRPRGREAHQRPLQGPDVLLRFARRRARVGRGGPARHAGPHVHVDRPGAELRARGRDPRHPVPVPRLQPRALDARRPDRPGPAAASSRPRASSRWPGARTASAT